MPKNNDQNYLPSGFKKAPSRERYDSLYSRRTVIRGMLLSSFLLTVGSVVLFIHYHQNPESEREDNENKDLINKILFSEELLESLTREELEAIQDACIKFYQTFGDPQSPLTITAHSDPQSMIYAFKDQMQLNIVNVRSTSSTLGTYSPELLSDLVLASMSRTMIEPTAEIREVLFVLNDSGTQVWGYKGFSLVSINSSGNLYDINFVDVGFADYFARIASPGYSAEDQLSILTNLIVQRSGLTPQQIFELYKNHNLVEFIRAVTKKPITSTEDVNYFLELFERAINEEDANALFGELETRYKVEQ